MEGEGEGGLEEDVFGWGLGGGVGVQPLEIGLVYL